MSHYTSWHAGIDVDDDGFVLSKRSHHPSRQFVAVKVTELKALEKSKNQSLLALAKRIRKSITENVAYRLEQDARNGQLMEMAEERRRDPAKREEDFQRMAQLAKLLGAP